MSRRKEYTGREYPEPQNPILSEVAELLREGALTERELAEGIGRVRSAPYVEQLRDLGYDIRTEWIDGEDKYVLVAIQGVAVSPARRRQAGSRHTKPRLRVVGSRG